MYKVTWSSCLVKFNLTHTHSEARETIARQAQQSLQYQAEEATTWQSSFAFLLTAIV
jgi:hypothetical protein